MKKDEFIIRWRLRIAFFKVKCKIKRVNKKILRLNKTLNNIQKLFENIRNIPGEKRIECEGFKARKTDWEEVVSGIEQHINNTNSKGLRVGFLGVGAGYAFSSLAPSAAMGIASTFGVSSTGTAISALSGVAAKSAALAWLGGGSLLVGGGGMALVNTVLFFLGIGGKIFSVTSFVACLLYFTKKCFDKKRYKKIMARIGRRDINSYNLANFELKERIKQVKNETTELKRSIKKIKSFGTDYKLMDEQQQYMLGCYVNLMLASERLISTPIENLKPNYIDSDFKEYIENIDDDCIGKEYYNRKNLIVSLCNLLYCIDLDKRDKKVMLKFFRSKKFLSQFGLTKKDIDNSVFDIVNEALSFKHDNYKTNALQTRRLTFDSY